MIISVNSSQNQEKDDQQSYDLLIEIVNIRRTSVVLKGGRAFSFSSMVVVGDGKGQIGLGAGSGLEVSVAIQKATKQAKQDMSQIVLNGSTIMHKVISRHGATKVFMRPASKGSGIIAGGAMRLVFKVAGVENVLAKIIGSTNPYNVCYATVSGLRQMYTPDRIVNKTGVKYQDVVANYQGGELSDAE